MTGVQQLLHVRVVDLAAFGLSIRPVRTNLLYFNRIFLPPLWGGLGRGFDPQTFVNTDTQPIKRLQDILLCSRHKTRRVGVLDTQEHVSSVLTGKQIVVQSGSHTADV